jgi:cell division protein FtsI/penicillin-binding protein 2
VRIPTVTRLTASIAVALLSLGTMAACTGASESPQRRAADRFLTAVGQHDVSQAAGATTDPAAARTTLQRSLAGLGATARAHFEIGSVRTRGSSATAAYSARWSLPGTTKSWSYRGTLPVTKRNGHWTVQWHATDLHPGLPAGTHLAVRRVQPPRAALLGSDGKPLFARTPVVRVGIEKKLVTDLGSLASALAAVPELQSTRTEIIRAVSHAAPTAFVPVITLRRSVYDRVRSRIHNLAGTVFQTDSQLLTRTAHFGQPLLGTVGPATQEIVANSHGRITADETTGIGGLQQALDARLAGTAGVTVAAIPDAGTAAPRTLGTVSPPHPGTDVALTLDPSVQAAAERALPQNGKAAAIVAVQRSTGRILADANTAATTYDYGLAGAFPPGSTFKIATWTAAFLTDARLTPSSRVACPSTTVVDGRRFINENRFSYPPIPVASAFGYSCNTSAIAEALTLPATALPEAARRLGLGAHWSLPVSAFSGSIAAPKTETERAADAIGQGRVLASPLVLALMASAADGGKVLTPTLTGSGTPGGATTLPAALTRKMHTLMSATIDLPAGTAHALAGLGPVVGKTGTAEYGNAKPPRTHAWFTGVRGDIAFAVFIYDGATNGGTAVPVARDLLTGLG